MHTIHASNSMLAEVFAETSDFELGIAVVLALVNTRAAILELALGTEVVQEKVTLSVDKD